MRTWSAFSDEQFPRLVLTSPNSMLKWEDNLRSHPAYVNAAIAASRVRVPMFIQWIRSDQGGRYGSPSTTIQHWLALLDPAAK